MIIDSGYVLYSKVAYRIEQNDPRMNMLLYAMEGTDSLRKKEYPQYKANRVATETTKYVAQLRVGMRERYRNLLTIKGCEADDVIALYVYLTGDNLVVGVDKDLLQIPSIELIMDNKGEMYNKTLANSPNLVAKTIHHYVDEPLGAYQWLLYLTLIGDKSDNIPRLVDKLHYGYATISEILLSDTPFRSAYDLYGERFIRNLGLVLLPHYSLLNISQMDILDILDHFIVNLPSTNWLTDDLVKPNVVDYIRSIQGGTPPPLRKNEHKFYENAPLLYRYITGLTEI